MSMAQRNGGSINGGNSEGGEMKAQWLMSKYLAMAWRNGVIESLAWHQWRQYLAGNGG